MQAGILLIQRIELFAAETEDRLAADYVMLLVGGDVSYDICPAA
jgi:hypothetical protein